ncbi:uncharacterized protein LOC142224257 [Haematobia irritans]|uniref:uncharacterized protein LOC142224257 n=1 Tax=Haematobia irritans TaxID=7368 RepID=UPI003F4F9773
MIAQEVNNSQIISYSEYHSKNNTSSKSWHDVKLSYEVSQNLDTPKPKSPKLSKKSKLKRLASAFNTKISRLLRREVNTKKCDKHLVNNADPKSAKLLTLPRASKSKTNIWLCGSKMEDEVISINKEFLSKIPDSPVNTKDIDLKHHSFNSNNHNLEFELLCEPKRIRSKSLDFGKTRNLWLETLKTQPERISTEQLLEETIEKLETMEVKDQEDVLTYPRSIPLASRNLISSESSTTSSAKHSEVEEIETDRPSSVSAVVESSSSSKNPSSLEEIVNKMENTSKINPYKLETPQDSKANSPNKPGKYLRKKKMRRTLSGRKEKLDEKFKTTSTSDSDTDYIKSRSIRTQPKKGHTETALNKSFAKANNSSIMNNNANQSFLNSSRSSKRESSMVNPVSSSVKTPQRDVGNNHTSSDSFDQGFETGSMDSPIRPSERSPRISIDVNQKPIMNSSTGFFSTPIKKQGQKSLSSAFNDSSNGILPQQAFSPIPMMMKSRRRSAYDSDSRRSSSIAMQVIREDRYWEHDNQSAKNKSHINQSFANNSQLDATNSMQVHENPKTSAFWIKSGSFYIALDIFENDPERVKLLYEIFCQKSCDTKMTFFGIDGHRFSVQKTNVEVHHIPNRWSHNGKTSHYWFSTGDMTIPFSGKLLSSEKIQRLFQFIKLAVDETGMLQFGVDDVEFSKVSELWNQSMSYSLDNSYCWSNLNSRKSMESQRKSSLPLSQKSRRSSSINRDLSDFESDDFKELESLRSSQSPFGSDAFESRSFYSPEMIRAPRNSECSMIESFGQGYENEPLDQLFKDSPRQKTDISKKLSIPDLMDILETQHRRLSNVKGRLSYYHNSPITSYDALEALRDSPEYLPLLKNIVSDISRIGCNNGFKYCSLEELERYMFFLSRYADICLNSCNTHMDKIMNTLREQKTIYV